MACWHHLSTNASVSTQTTVDTTIAFIDQRSSVLKGSNHICRTFHKSASNQTALDLDLPSGLEYAMNLRLSTLLLAAFAVSNHVVDAFVVSPSRPCLSSSNTRLHYFFAAEGEVATTERTFEPRPPECPPPLPTTGDLNRDYDLLQQELREASSNLRELTSVITQLQEEIDEYSTPHTDDDAPLLQQLSQLVVPTYKDEAVESERLKREDRMVYAIDLLRQETEKAEDLQHHLLQVEEAMAAY